MLPTNRAFTHVVAVESPMSLRTSAGRTNFYREELVKHWRCLDEQREYYSEKAITDVEAVLQRLMREMDILCARENGDQLVSRLLRKIDGVTRLSAWSDEKKSH
jgi:hypothetical protein